MSLHTLCRVLLFLLYLMYSSFLLRPTSLSGILPLPRRDLICSSSSLVALRSIDYASSIVLKYSIVNYELTTEYF